jgi:hypothetical protein
MSARCGGRCEMSSLAELGDWPSIEIGSHSVIRHAYENVLNACARLASFATGGPTTTDGPISQQQEILAVDDLVAFAIHARRLIENTASLHAIEVRIFPESLRGAGEGQYPWDLKPDSVMTNATVGTITQAPQGNVIKVSYKGTKSEYTVDPTTPIFANATGDSSLLIPGAAVFVIASKHDDGKLTSTRLYVEKDGIKPPM